MRHTFTATSLTVATIAVAAMGCDKATGPRTATEPPACYRLTLGAWRGTHEATDPPPYVALENDIGTDGMESGKTLVRPVPTGATSAYPWMWWEPAPDDVLHLVFTGGFVGLEIDVQRGADSWKGTAAAFSDVGGTQATAAAELSPMVCPP